MAEADIEPWAIPFIADQMKSKLPSAHLFPGITNSGASHHHARCCDLAGVDDYTLKDARHSVAVRMRKRGATFEQIADQLGNSVAICVSVYARFNAEPPAKKQDIA